MGFENSAFPLTSGTAYNHYGARNVGGAAGAETTFQIGSEGPNTAYHRVQLKNAAGSATDRTYISALYFGN